MRRVSFVLAFAAMSSFGAEPPVTMAVPFVPIGAANPVKVVGGIEVDVTYQGLDENGHSIYATVPVEIGQNELADMMNQEAGSGNPGYTVPINENGWYFNPPGDPAYIMQPGSAGAGNWSEFGTCRRNNPPAGTGATLGVAATETLASCAGLLEDYWGGTFSNLVRLYISGTPPCQYSGRVEWRDSPEGTLRGHFAPNETGCIAMEPDWPIQQPSPVPPNKLTDLVPEGPPPPPGVIQTPRPLDPTTFNLTIINNYTNVTAITTTISTITNEYETTGTVTGVTGGTRDRPTGTVRTVTGGGGTEPVGEGQETLTEFCIKNPTILICEDTRALGTDDVEGSLGEVEEARGGLLDTATELLDDLGEYVPGTGPSLGPAASGCPLAGGIEVSGSDLVIDTTAVCEAAGGPIRQLILILGAIWSGLVLLRGLSL